MALGTLDWIVVAAYGVFALAVGLVYARRAGRDADEYFLSGRRLPWWIAGTSMVATTFACDTPLIVTGWVRDFGIWKNWLWWCLAAGAVLTIFLFARYWRRGRVMTTAELAELRYGGADARVLRGFLGVYHAGITNALTLCWVMLAASKILEATAGVDKLTALCVAGGLALSYSLLAGLWGVVLTDLVQFAMAMAGAVTFAAIALGAVGGMDAVRAAVEAGPRPHDTLSFFPSSGDAAFWTVPLASVCVYLGVSWWATDGVDGGATVVQRIAATRDERQGVLAVLWFAVAHYALRPWPWFAVALASLVVLPDVRVEAPAAGTVAAVDAEGGSVTIAPAADRADETVRWEVDGDWHAEPVVAVGDVVKSGAVVARTDSESAYPRMMARYLPAGLLGLVFASLFAAFMSTVDTHVNVASSFFVNDVYRRFLVTDAGPRHYVLVARLASAGVLVLGGAFALVADSLHDLFTFFLALLGGVGPIYVLRWLWWRVRASTEIAAMIASSVSATFLTFADVQWPLGPLAPGGELTDAGRIVLVVTFSVTVALGSMAFTRDPDPRDLVRFYRRVRPMGAWHPVRHHCKDVPVPREAAPVLFGAAGTLAGIYALLVAIGSFVLGSPGVALMSLGFAVAGGGVAYWALRRLGI